MPKKYPLEFKRDVAAVARRGDLTVPPRSDLQYAIVYWIEHTYNRRRPQRGVGKLTPVEYELAVAPQAARTAA